ncbi:hypothetical protein MRB53_040424 [Persea americana]|nr:hypothetical protein MRB53_040424 [Persea americana]
MAYYNLTRCHNACRNTWPHAIRRRTSDLYPSAIHRPLGYVLVIGILFSTAHEFWVTARSSALKGFTRLQQDDTMTSEDSLRSSATLCRESCYETIDAHERSSQKADPRDFNGIAHWAKSSVFFLFGIWVFVRYVGGFASTGHAWSDTAASATSAEMYECGLIAFYGHVAAAGTIGLLLESKRLKRLLFGSERHKVYNIMPALVVFFTDLQLAAIHGSKESSERSSCGILSDRRSSVAFCLIAGALVFMMSARDVVQSLEHNEIGLMFVISLSVAGALTVMMWTIYAMVVRRLGTQSIT